MSEHLVRACIACILNTMFTNANGYVHLKQIKKDPADFAMLTRGYIREIRELSRRSPCAFQVFMLLTERMNKTNAIVISQTTLCQILNYGRTAIHNAIRLLESERWLQIVKIGTANGYIINSKVVWRDHSGKRYASFYAEVVASESDQGRPVEDWDSIELRHVPILQAGEHPISTGELPPPDQVELLPLTRDEVPRVRINDAEN